jgi:hypothetical protein
MLETLDTISWNRLRHCCGFATDIPDNLRLMLSPHSEDFELGLGELWGSVNLQGEINSTSPHVIPFMIEMLAESSFPHKARLFDYLMEQIECTQNYARFSIGSVLFRYTADTYNNVSAGVDVYLRLLNDSDVEVRFSAARLLGELGEHAPRLRVKLRRALQKEQSGRVRAELHWALAKMVTFLTWKEYDLRLAYQKRFAGSLKTSTSREERIAAAVSWAKTMMSEEWHQRIKNLPDEIFPTLLDAFIYPLKSEKRIPFGYAEQVLDSLVRLGSPILSDALKVKNLPPPVAHTLGRELLDKLFERREVGNRQNYIERDISYMKWSSYESWWISHDVDRRIYNRNTNHPSPRQYRADVPLAPFQKEYLKPLIDCRAFWKLETNVFSFFYGLPDSRDELRKLIRG